MSKIFTIEIAPVRKPFMREKQHQVTTVCKYRDGTKGYKYSEYAYGKPQCGRVYRWAEGENTESEREPHMTRFMKHVERAYQKACVRYNSHYANMKRADHIVRVYAPYPDVAPNATITVMSAKWKEWDRDQRFLSDIRSKMRIQYGHLMSSLQRGEWDRSNDSLYLLNKYMYDLQSMCRPDHHEVVFKGEKNPLLANRR